MVSAAGFSPSSTQALQRSQMAPPICRDATRLQVEMYKDGFNQQIAMELASCFDVIVDATDNAPSRYLISDACVLAGKPLVSGAAIGTDGQLTVYNHGPDGGPPFMNALL